MPSSVSSINTPQKLYVKGANRQHIPLLVFQYFENYIFLGLITSLISLTL